jgi:LmbE family N-acetylglucosaminyl deacetylase
MVRPTLDSVADHQLISLPADTFTRVLCVVAHPDDMEYGASSAVAAWTAAGVDVHYLLLTRGGAGIDTMHPAQTAEVRSAEQTAACKAVGVEDVEFLDHPETGCSSTA